MLVVISSEAPKKRKIYHKMGCIYAERIKFQNLLEIKVEQAEIHLMLIQIIRNLSGENFTDKKM